MITRTLIGAMLVLAMAGAHATMYKWKDAQGQVQFGQFPPAGVDAERIKTPHAPHARPPASAGPDLQERVRALEARKAAEQEKAQAEQQRREQAARVKQNCENARLTIQRLGRGGNRRYRMPDGSYQRFNAEESRKRIEESRKYIKENCS